MEVYKIVKFLSDNQLSAKRVLVMKGSQGAGCKEIGKQAMTYVFNRHLFKDGAYSIKLDGFNQEDVMSSIIRKMRLPIYDNDMLGLIQYIKDNPNIVIQFQIDDTMDEEQKKSLMLALKDLVENTDNLKILCAIDADVEFDKNLLLDGFDLMPIGSMEPKDAMKLMFDINKTY